MKIVLQYCLTINLNQVTVKLLTPMVGGLMMQCAITNYIILEGEDKKPATTEEDNFVSKLSADELNEVLFWCNLV